MLRPAELCPPWEYSDHPRRVAVLRLESERLLIHLRSGELDSLAAARDTRPIHRRLFEELVPLGHWQYAGHYRGEPVDCLWNYRVFVAGDPRVGYEPNQVLASMERIQALVEEGCRVLDKAHAEPNTLPEHELRITTVAFACRVFELFLRVHPFANGNGHAARFCMWALLGRYGYWPIRWPIEPRPPDPPYTDLIARHRDGDTEPLEQFVLASLS